MYPENSSFIKIGHNERFTCRLMPIYNNKGQVHPGTGHKDPERSSSTLPSTSALDGGGWSTPSPGRFTPEKDTVSIVQEAG